MLNNLETMVLVNSRNYSVLVLLIQKSTTGFNNVI